MGVRANGYVCQWLISTMGGSRCSCEWRRDWLLVLAALEGHNMAFAIVRNDAAACVEGARSFDGLRQKDVVEPNGMRTSFDMSKVRGCPCRLY